MQANGRAARDAARAKEQAEARQSTASLAAELAAVRTMSVSELREVYTRLFGQESHSRNKGFLGKKISWGLQERAAGGPSPGLKAQVDLLLGGTSKVRFRAYQGRAAFAASAEALAEPAKEVVKPPRRKTAKPARRPNSQAAGAPTSEVTPAVQSNPAAKPKWMTDARLPPTGTVLRKTYRGRTYLITVVEDGFEYQQQHYTSLSTIAKRITGTAWNGYAFFGLEKRNQA